MQKEVCYIKDKNGVSEYVNGETIQCFDVTHSWSETETGVVTARNGITYAIQDARS